MLRTKPGKSLPVLGLAAVSVASGCIVGDDGADRDLVLPDTVASGSFDADRKDVLDVTVPDHCVPVHILHHKGKKDDDKKGKKGKGKGKKPKKPKGDKHGNAGGGAPLPPVALGAEPLQPGVGPETADQCGPASAALPGLPGDDVVDRQCFFGADDPTPQATIERVLESVDDIDTIHVRLTFNPHFVDNSYGDTAVGWEESKKGGHTFKELVGSDHAELQFTDGAGDVALHVKLDYLSEDSSQPSGYGTLGVSGGKNDGEVLEGNPAHILEVATSLDRNLNGCTYGDYTENSPASDLAYTPNPAAPDWDFRVIYEVWIDSAAFGTAGFGEAIIEYVHASPSKTGSNTVFVEPGPCPPDDTPETPDPPQDDPPGDDNPPGDDEDPPGDDEDPPGDDEDPPGDNPPSDPPDDGEPPDDDMPPCPPGTVPRTPETPDPNDPEDPNGPTPETPDPNEPEDDPTPETPDDGPVPEFPDPI